MLVMGTLHGGYSFKNPIIKAYPLKRTLTQGGIYFVFSTWK